MPSLRNFHPRRAALAALGGAVLSLFGGAGQSATLKTGYYTIDAMAMAPDQMNSASSYAIVWTDGLRNTAANQACFNTAVNLPNGANITRVVVWYTANAGVTANTSLFRQQLSDGLLGYVAFRDLNGTAAQRKGADVALFSTDAAVIQNARFSYGFAICLPGESKATFHSVRVTYSYVD